MHKQAYFYYIFKINKFKFVKWINGRFYAVCLTSNLFQGLQDILNFIFYTFLNLNNYSVL